MIQFFYLKKRDQGIFCNGSVKKRIVAVFIDLFLLRRYPRFLLCTAVKLGLTL